MTCPEEAADLITRLERIKYFSEQLIRIQADSTDARALAERIKQEVEAARSALKAVSS